MSQIDYHTERVKRMVGKVLTGNGITRCERGTYALVGGEQLSDAERDALLELCRQRLEAFREPRGEEVFAHRSRHRTPINSSVKYRVHRCARVSGDNEVGRSATSSLAGGVSAGDPGADAQGPGDAGTTDEPPT
ncbi:hypothetical protein KBZ34_18670, partial [Cyanobium sp. Cruz-8H5]|nr:hypothetical protein [Cyanobium sp. Cruz-8H5]